MLMGFTPASSGFLIFFMILALSRLFSKALKDSIESPSFKVIYQTIDERIRFGIQSGMDGTVNEISALSSGLLLAGLGILSFIKLIHFSWVLALISALWLLVAIRLYAEYRKSIRKALEPGLTMGEHIVSDHDKTGSDNPLSAALAFENDFYSLASGDLSVLDPGKDSSYYNLLLDYSQGSKDVCMLPALKKLVNSPSAPAGVKSRAALVAETLELDLAEPGYSEDRLVGYRKSIVESRNYQTSEILRLLRDNSKDARKLAVIIIGKFRINDLLPELCQCIGREGLELHAANAIRSFGEKASGELQRYYSLASGSVKACKSVLRIMSSDCNRDNTNFLFTRLWSGSRELRELALEGLLKCNFRPSEPEKDKLHQLITDTIGILVWNLSAGISLQKQGDSSLLDILKSETERWNRFLFGLLSVAYEASSIVRIKENLDSGTVESVNYALEMIDIVIDESIKPKIIPLVDIIPDEEKIKNLFQFFPGEIPQYNQLIDSILNRDYNLLGIWIRANALRQTDKPGSPAEVESVSALLFSPEQILREEAALLLSRTDKALLSDLITRLPADKAEAVRKLQGGTIDNQSRIFEKLSFLSHQLPGAAEDRLLGLAHILEYQKVNDLMNVSSPDDSYIMWSCRNGSPVPGKMLILEEGGLKKLKVSEAEQDYFYLLRFRNAIDFCVGNPDLSGELIDQLVKNENKI
jgi:hypothetical protein